MTSGTPGAEPQTAEPALGSLSPSRAADFKSCPLRYRFRVLDRLPERSSPAAVRGTLVHAVLEHLFDLPASERTPQTAAALVPGQWQRLLADDPQLAEVLGPNPAPGAGITPATELLASATALLDGYFALEDPRRLEPAERECLVEVQLASGLRLRGYIDRLDRAITGEVRIVDYKTGRVPGEAYEAPALFQLKFYALVLWRRSGSLPRELLLLYLNDAVLLRYRPEQSELAAFERLLEALGKAIATATASGDFRPRRGAACRWCDHEALCPAWGGTPPPLPAPQLRTAVLEGRPPKDPGVVPAQEAATGGRGIA